ncbi:hypothetical protein EXM63_06650 [Clostridium botulinum]|uniref:DUF4258 domain-containing protein n=1 Tax=Clostridium botulinum TaxID=1491 RepID=A0A6M0SX86_CLOBO|nr:hypothetical protein [Clostridium botulinum]NFI74297.1 hypothetical protein [Clostridium sporogenes]NFP62205.1 hypothetical protein [Clostridium sporogenes]NFU95643.1 hypothetical protein [Clostridium sporogenes]NFV68707.1 hypothetical protein [Clostridium botulinum]
MLNIIVTKHAINRYISRILSDGEKVNITKIKEDLINIALNGQLITKKKMINEENSWKKVIQYDEITILVIEKKYSRVIITCLGDNTSHKWYKTQKLKDQRKLY